MINPLNISRIFYKDSNEMILRLTSNFDWKFYLDFYPDLRMNGIHTEDQEIYHYSIRGNIEGRLPNKIII